MVAILKRFEDYCEFKTPLVWRNVIVISLFHLLGIYGFTLLPTAKLATPVWIFLCGLAADTAISAGAHRLWTHRTYKASLSMRIFVMLIYSMGGLYSLVQWARDHRAHHAYADTDADPHNAQRGLIFSHVGWLMMRRHPDLKRQKIDVDDLWQDPVVRFHQKHFKLLFVIMHVIFPQAVAYFVIGESLKNIVFAVFFFRYMLTLNLLWCTNSLAHYWGYRPYNKNIKASGNAFLAFILVGEGWHNFHHTFPWDYRAAERGQPWQFSSRTIEVFAWLGLAKDLKVASPDLIRKVKERNLPKNFEAPETGFDDTNYPKKEIKVE